MSTSPGNNGNKQRRGANQRSIYNTLSRWVASKLLCIFNASEELHRNSLLVRSMSMRAFSVLAKIPSFPLNSFHLELSIVFFFSKVSSQSAFTTSLAAPSKSLSFEMDVFLPCWQYNSIAICPWGSQSTGATIGLLLVQCICLVVHFGFTYLTRFVPDKLSNMYLVCVAHTLLNNRTIP